MLDTTEAAYILLLYIQSISYMILHLISRIPCGNYIVIRFKLKLA